MNICTMIRVNHDFFVNINPSGAVTFENMSGPLLNMFNLNPSGKRNILA